MDFISFCFVDGVQVVEIIRWTSCSSVQTSNGGCGTRRLGTVSSSSMVRYVAFYNGLSVCQSGLAGVVPPIT